MLPAAIFGLIIGAFLGLLGAGGSILAIPALIYGVGLPLDSAIPTSLLVVALSAATGLIARWQSNVIRWPVALVFAAASVPAAFAGTAIGKLVSDRWLLVAFAGLMVTVAARMLTGTTETGGACRTSGGTVNWRSCLPKALGAGAVVGVLTGVFGVGGGFIIVPALTMLLGLTASEAVATSLVVVTVTALAGLGAHVTSMPDLNYPIAIAFAAAAMISATVAGRLGHRMPAATIQRVFAYLILTVAIAVAATALFAPEILHGG
ncbi:sulfite exporter TauE/SafE family protein [Nocardia brasiliensis]|uniref:sulfite exporter TauE/SafE family protein n=1 Tax=Nocardia brasiliensis TaxID=37326 RepID=UPI0024565B64|nr:sulfite exporter TauE/SafE family protein [Nocardia brasiliensis]